VRVRVCVRAFERECGSKHCSIASTTGGFYLDMDMEIERSMESLRGKGCVVPWEGGAAGNYAFGATRGHPFIRHVIETLVAGAGGWRDGGSGGGSGGGNGGGGGGGGEDSEGPNAVDLIMHGTGPQIIERALNTAPPPLRAQVELLRPTSGAWYLFGDVGRHGMSGSWRHEAEEDPCASV